MNYPKTIEASTIYAPTDREIVIARLAELGYPALPVAPKQDPIKYPLRDGKGAIVYEKDGVTPKPKFTGKNPSFLDSQGIPHTVYHQSYQNSLPSASDLKKWFINPSNGIGTLGGFQGSVWLDFDVKDFDSQSDCDEKFQAWLCKSPQLRESWIEQTHSGGYRVLVSCKDKPDFTNFALEPGGRLRGEALGVGRFTVLAPTVGVSGNAYELLTERVAPIEVESLESIGIYAKGKAKTANKTIAANPLVFSTSAFAPSVSTGIELRDLGHPTSKEVLRGVDIQNDRSDSLTTAIQEWYGWENWTRANDLAVNSSTELLATEAGLALGIDEDRIDRILATIESLSCAPATYSKGGDKPCWQHIKKLNREIYEKLCPMQIKTEIEIDIEAFKKSIEVTANETWTERTEADLLLESQLAENNYVLTEYKWRLLICEDYTQSVYQVCAQNGFNTEKPVMPMVEGSAFCVLDEILKAIPDITQLAHYKGYFWKTFLMRKKRITHDTLAIYRVFGDGLRFNKLRLVPEIGDVEMTVDDLKTELETINRETLVTSKEEAISCFMTLARKRSFNPVTEYLESCRASFSEGLSAETILEKVFKIKPGNDSTWFLFVEYLKRFLIGAVARAYIPGCKHRTVFVLKGGQYIGKSNFFNILAGKWFDDSIAMAAEKDDKLKMNRAWICEWQELEAIIGKKESGKVKAWISSSTDIVRPPYEKAIRDLPRPSVLCASVNEDSFLVDTTGNSRYWVLDVGDTFLDLDWLTQNRNAVWAYALNLYESGYRFWFDPKDPNDLKLMQQQAEQNERFATVDPWTEAIELKLKRSNSTTTSEVMECVEPDISKRTKGTESRVSKILKSLDWQKDKDQTRVGNSRIRFWRRVEPIDEPIDEEF